MDMLYVGLQDNDKIAVFALDGESRRAGEAGPMCRQAAGRRLWRSVRTAARFMSAIASGHSIASYRIDPASGGVSLSGTAAQADAPTFLAPDRTGRYMLLRLLPGRLCRGASVSQADGTVGAAALAKEQGTAIGAHAIAADPLQSVRFCAAHRPDPGQRVGAAQK